MSNLKSSAGRHGELRLSLSNRNNQTIVTDSYCRVPLQVMKPIRDRRSGAVCFYLLSPTGGIVQGDDYQIRVDLSNNAYAVLTTQAATKVYAMPKGSAKQQVDFYVGKNSVLEYLPDPTILFQAADFEQQVNLHVNQEGGKIVFQEIIMPGRLARGEIMAFKRYRSQLRGYDEDGIILYDSFCLEPEQNPPNNLISTTGVLDSYPCWGSWYLLGDCSLITPKWQRICDVGNPLLNQDGKSTGGITQLHRNGMAIRMLACNAQTIQFTFRNIWDWIKTEILALKKIDLRKY